MKHGEDFSFHFLTYSLWGLLGATAFSGVFLAVYYLPSFAQAFASVQRLQEQVPFGWMFRGLHAAGGSFLLLLFLLHLLRVFYSGDYKGRPPWVWAAEVLLILFTLGANISGFFLPLSQDAYWGTAGALSSFSTIPGVGKFLAEFLRGGRELGGTALSRFFAMHIGFAALLAFLAFTHARRSVSETRAEARGMGSLNLWTGAGVAFVLFAAVAFAPLWFADPLREAANPAVNPESAFPPWYLAFILETLSPFNSAYPLLSILLFGGVLALIFFLPHIDRTGETNLLLRPVALSLGSAVLVAAVYFTFWGMAGADEERGAVIPRDRVSPAEVRGARVYVEKNCAFCHQVLGRDGRREGPDMAVVLQRKRTPEWVQRFILNARLYQPGTTMPRYEIPLDDLEALSAYLLSLDPKARNLHRVDREFLKALELLGSKESLKK